MVARQSAAGVGDRRVRGDQLAHPLYRRAVHFRRAKGSEHPADNAEDQRQHDGMRQMDDSCQQRQSAFCALQGSIYIWCIMVGCR
jgi:hypothetical protein